MDPHIRMQTKKNILRESIAKVTDDQQINWDEVRTKVAQGDITYTVAITIAQQKIEAFEKSTGNEKGLKLFPLYRNTRLISHILMTIYVCLSLFQKPAWCLAPTIYAPGENSYYADCSGTVLEGSVIVVSTLPYLETWQLVFLEVLCVTLLTIRRMLHKYIKQSKSSYYQVLLFITVLVYLSDILQYSVGITFPFNQFLRPIYLMTYVKMIRKTLMLYMRIVWKSKEVFVIIAGIFFIYVSIGRIFFYESPQNAPGTANFDTFTDTLYNLFVSLSTSNYPDDSMPIYEKDRFAILYWVFLIGFVNMVFLRIVIAYFYLYYKEELLAQAARFQQNQALLKVFNDPEFNDPSKQSQSQVKVSIKAMLEQMELLHEEDAAKIFGNSIWKRKLLEKLNTFSLKTVFALGSLAAFLGAVIQSNDVSPDYGVPITPEQAVYNATFNEAWIIAEFIWNLLLFMDPFLRVLCLGWRYVLKSKFLIFEFMLSITIQLLLALSLFGDNSLSLTPVKLILVLRFCRFMKWVNCFEKYNLIFDTLFKLIPLFLNLLGVLGVAFCLYATAGEVMFGGYVKTNSPINFNQYGDPEYYVYENFNDFFMGLFACYHLLIVNNWLYTVDVACKVMNNYLYRIFFISFYILTGMICFNILTAFILDVFVTQISNKNAKMKIERKESFRVSRSESISTKILRKSLNRSRTMPNLGPNHEGLLISENIQANSALNLSQDLSESLLKDQ